MGIVNTIRAKIDVVIGGVYTKKTAKTDKIKYKVENILTPSETGYPKTVVYFYSPQTGTHYQRSLKQFMKIMKRIG